MWKKCESGKLIPNHPGRVDEKSTTVPMPLFSVFSTRPLSSALLWWLGLGFPIFFLLHGSFLPFHSQKELLKKIRAKIKEQNQYEKERKLELKIAEKRRKMEEKMQRRRERESAKGPRPSGLRQVCV